MTAYAGANGVPFTDEDIERWADEAEAGFLGWKFGTLVDGRAPYAGWPERKMPVLNLGAALDEERDACEW